MTVRNRFVATVLLTVAAAALLSSPAHAARRADACTGPGIRVLVKDQSTGTKVPLEGVGISVTGGAGSEVVSGKTDAKGIALLCVPEKADYSVSVDTSTLGEGKELQGEAKVDIAKDRFTTEIKTVSFFTGAAQRVTEGYWALLVKALVNGIRLGIVIAMRTKATAELAAALQAATWGADALDVADCFGERAIAEQ